MRRLILLLATTALAGCDLVPDMTTPTVAAPPAYANAQQASLAPASSSPANLAEADLTDTWWTSFGSAELNQLMATARANNYDIKAALARIEAMTAELELGRVYRAEVVSIKDFGCFVRIGEHEGLVHVSELAATRVDKVGDVVKVGEAVDVKVLGADERGRLKLSRKAALK